MVSECFGHPNQRQLLDDVHYGDQYFTQQGMLTKNCSRAFAHICVFTVVIDKVHCSATPVKIEMITIAQNWREQNTVDEVNLHGVEIA